MLLTLLALATATPGLQTQAQELFSNQSTNPSATQFRNVRTIGDAVCGEVNKPNRQGGYDGFQKFVYLAKDRWAVEQLADYQLREPGKYSNTKAMWDRSLELFDRRQHTEASELQDQAERAVGRAEALFEACR